MRSFHVLLAWVVLALVSAPHAHAQAVLGAPTVGSPFGNPFGNPVGSPAELPPLPPAKITDQEILRLQKSIEHLQIQQVVAQGAAQQQDDKLKQEVDLLQKQIAYQTDTKLSDAN